MVIVIIMKRLGRVCGSGIFDMRLVSVNLWLGPYNSCQDLSIIKKFFILGASKGNRCEETKWENQIEIEASPNLINIFDLNDKVIPIKTPKNMEIKILIFVFVGIINSCSGVDSHRMVAPEVIDIGAIIKIGYSNLFEGWFNMSGFVFKIKIVAIFNIRTEYAAVIPIDIVINEHIVKEKLE